ncbi:hypothetical protein HK096_002745, partial [Nowakowskiella sp. JEL0078]
MLKAHYRAIDVLHTPWQEYRSLIRTRFVDLGENTRSDSTAIFDLKKLVQEYHETKQIPNELSNLIIFKKVPFINSFLPALLRLPRENITHVYFTPEEEDSRLDLISILRETGKIPSTLVTEYENLSKEKKRKYQQIQNEKSDDQLCKEIRLKIAEFCKMSIGIVEETESLEIDTLQNDVLSLVQLLIQFSESTNKPDQLGTTKLEECLRFDVITGDILFLEDSWLSSSTMNVIDDVLNFIHSVFHNRILSCTQSNRNLAQKTDSSIGNDIIQQILSTLISQKSLHLALTAKLISLIHHGSFSSKENRKRVRTSSSGNLSLDLCASVSRIFVGVYLQEGVSYNIKIRGSEGQTNSEDVIHIIFALFEKFLRSIKVTETATRICCGIVTLSHKLNYDSRKQCNLLQVIDSVSLTTSYSLPWASWAWIIDTWPDLRRKTPTLEEWISWESQFGAEENIEQRQKTMRAYFDNLDESDNCFSTLIRGIAQRIEFPSASIMCILLLDIARENLEGISNLPVSVFEILEKKFSELITIICKTDWFGSISTNEDYLTTSKLYSDQNIQNYTEIFSLLIAGTKIDQNIFHKCKLGEFWANASKIVEDFSTGNRVEIEQQLKIDALATALVFRIENRVINSPDWDLEVIMFLKGMRINCDTKPGTLNISSTIRDRINLYQNKQTRTNICSQNLEDALALIKAFGKYHLAMMSEDSSVPQNDQVATTESNSNILPEATRSSESEKYLLKVL